MNTVWAATAVRRGTPCSAPSWAWASTGQTLPGRYLPTWATKNTAAAFRGASLVPSPARRRRQISPETPTPASAQAIEPTSGPTSATANRSRTSSPRRATATTVATATAARYPQRSTARSRPRAGGGVPVVASAPSTSAER